MVVERRLEDELRWREKPGVIYRMGEEGA